ncbi:MAG TPA: thermosome subunit [Methanomicrobia archaeon]|nr:thermosome subunit [Methanomicrobia archaeon]HEX58930.1 thermosome subunit [Methanomicrobia archaeon]
MEPVKLPLKVLQGKPERLHDEELRESSFAVAKELSDFLASTLGPQSLQKMIVEDEGRNFIISSDGKTIMQRFDLMQFRAKHPVAVLFRELSKTQDYDVGDGTTTTVVLAGELLDEARKLVSMGLHPNIIADGYKMAVDKALEILEELAFEATDDILYKVARTAIDTKYLEVAEELSKIVVEAVKIISDGGKKEANPEDVHVARKGGKEAASTTLFRGIILEKSFLHEDMPKRVENVRVAVIDAPLTVKPEEGMFASHYLYSTRAKSLEDVLLQAEYEREILREKVKRIKDAGADVIISRRLIDKRLVKTLLGLNMVAIQAVPTGQILERIAKAVNARIVTNISEISEDDLGYAEYIEEVKFPDKSTFVFIKGTNPKSVTIFLRGGAQHTLSDFARAVNDGLHAVAKALNKKVLPGGGAVEVELALRLRKFAMSDATKRQLAISAFADALEVIPKTLARNSGRDPLSILLELRKEHANGNLNYGYDARAREIRDVVEAGILESLRLKEMVIKGAYEAALIVLRSDDILYGDVLRARIEEEEKKRGSYSSVRK